MRGLQRFVCSCLAIDFVNVCCLHVCCLHVCCLHVCWLHCPPSLSCRFRWLTSCSDPPPPPLRFSPSLLSFPPLARSPPTRWWRWSSNTWGRCWTQWASLRRLQHRLRRFFLKAAVHLTGWFSATPPSHLHLPSFQPPPPSTLPLLVQATALGKEVEAAVWTQAVFTHPVTKQQVFAYEVDG